MLLLCAVTGLCLLYPRLAKFSAITEWQSVWMNRKTETTLVGGDSWRENIPILQRSENEHGFSPSITQVAQNLRRNPECCSGVEIRSARIRHEDAPYSRICGLVFANFLSGAGESIEDKAKFTKDSTGRWRTTSIYRYDVNYERNVLLHQVREGGVTCRVRHRELSPYLHPDIGSLFVSELLLTTLEGGISNIGGISGSLSSFYGANSTDLGSIEDAMSNIGVIGNYEQGQDSYYPCNNMWSPVRPSIDEQWRIWACASGYIVALILGMSGFWFVKSAFRTEHIGVLGCFKVFLAALLMFSVLPISHASLDLLYFGRIYLEHLF